jgi:hypothetical protein
VWERELRTGNGFHPEAVQAIRVGKLLETMIYSTMPCRGCGYVSSGCKENVLFPLSKFSKLEAVWSRRLGVAA